MFKQYKDGSTVTVRDENFLELRNTRPKDPKEWRGRVEFGWRHKPQLRHVQKSAPRPYDPLTGREKSEVVNDEIVKFRKSDDPMEVVEEANLEPEVLDRQIRVSRNVEEHELENALRSLPQHGSRMKELLLQVFNLEDPETAAPRTADRWILLPRCWIRMHHERRDCYFHPDHPDDAPAPVDGLLSDCSWTRGVIDTQCSAIRVIRRRLTLAIKMNGLTSRCRVLQMRISAVHHIIAGVIHSCKWLASIVGVDEVVGKDGNKIDVEVNAEEGEIEPEMRLAEPLLWESEFPPEAEKKGMMKEMNSTKDFDVYDEVLVKDCTEEQVNE
eukprot:s6871_g4.t1